MNKLNFSEAVDKIIAGDPRYDREVYQFVREGLDFTLKMLKKTGAGKERHVSGQELLEGLRRFSLQEFGPMTKTVLNYWGVTRCEDFAEIVFHLVDTGILGKTEQDTKDDFKGGFDFEEAFVKPYLPPPPQLLGAVTGHDSIPARSTPPAPGRKSTTKKLSGGSN